MKPQPIRSPQFQRLKEGHPYLRRRFPWTIGPQRFLRHSQAPNRRPYESEIHDRRPLLAWGEAWAKVINPLGGFLSEA
jgi:hypothetical protein